MRKMHTSRPRGNIGKIILGSRIPTRLSPVNIKTIITMITLMFLRGFLNLPLTGEVVLILTMRTAVRMTKQEVETAIRRLESGWNGVSPLLKKAWRFPWTVPGPLSNSGGVWK